MDFREWLETFFRYVTPFAIVVAFIMFEATGTPYSDLFTAALVNALGVLGINAYGKVRR